MNNALLTWYWQNKRDLPWRRSRDPYAIWVSEVMLQQTQVNTVIPYYERFLQAFPTLEHLAEATEDQVLSLWKGLGYYSRARNLWRGARYVQEELNGQLPQDVAGLRTIPGVGEYTAGAIASMAFGLKVPAIDGNVHRVLARLLAWREDVDSAQSKRHFKEKLEIWQPEDYPGEFNQALMDLGAMICTPKTPKCGSCPLNSECEAYRLNEALNFPVKRPRTKPRPLIRLTFVLYRSGQVYLQQRSEGLLARLWEFPGCEIEVEKGSGSPTQCWRQLRAISPEQYLAYYREAVSERSFDPLVEKIIEQRLKFSGPISYTFSHRKWQIFWTLLDLGRLTDQFSAQVTGQISAQLIEQVTEGDAEQVTRQTMKQVSEQSSEQVSERFKEQAVEQVLETPATYKTVEPQSHRWVRLEDLADQTIAVAFNEIIEALQAHNITTPWKNRREQ